MLKARLLALACLAAIAATPLAAQTPQTGTSTGASRPAATAPAAPSATAPSATAKAPLLDINSASTEELDALPGVGTVRAAAIIKGRPYKGKDDLLKRKILPSNVYNGIKDRIIAKQS